MGSEMCIRDRNAEGRSVEVINYSVPGYSTTHELKEVERALAEEADLVILQVCLLYTSDAADERSSVDLGGRRIIKKKKIKIKKKT